MSSIIPLVSFAERQMIVMLKTYTEFTKKLLCEFTEKHGNENIVISPYSVANLLAMSAEAASGNTRNEIVKSILPNGTYDKMTSIISDLNEKISDAVYAANAAFVKDEISESIHKDYADDLNEKYGGDLLISNNLTESINKWISEKTKGMISQITDESMSDVLVCLINAIFFHDEWANEYEDGDIENNRKFSNADGTISKVTMMTSCEKDYIESQYFTGFAKPYKNGFTYMALLPAKKGQAFLQKAVKNIDFSTLYNNRSKKTVTVNMPEYSCEFGGELNQTLMNMGIKELFTTNADLSNMSSEWLKMDSVIHKAKIEVNRQGTRAASVTAGEMGDGNAPVFEQFKNIILDRPFVYAIIHDKTGIPLFVGTVNQLPDEKKIRLDHDLFIHPSDKAAMKALKAIPGFSQVMKAFMKIWNEKTFRIMNMSSNLKLSENQMKKYYDMLPPICEKLGIDIPELYVTLDVVPNAYTYGDTKPFIVITSGLFETLPDELIPSVIAHECGHIACHHTLYRTMGKYILSGASYFTNALGNLALYPIQLAFVYWMRCSELSADRAAAVYDGNSDKVVETMMRFAGYDKDIMAEANAEEFMEQAKEYRQMVNTNAWNKTLEFILLKNEDHPLTAVRALEAYEWAQSDRFEIIKSYLNAPESTLLPMKLYPQKYIGKNADKIHSELSELGFTNVELVRIAETNKKAKARDVISVSIDGSLDCDNDFYLRTSKIILTYFEPKTDEEIAIEHPAEIQMTESSKYYIGKPFDFTENALKSIGFTNLELKEMAIPKIGFLLKPNAVAKITIDGTDNFEKNSWHAPDTRITIYYYVKI